MVVQLVVYPVIAPVEIVHAVFWTVYMHIYSNCAVPMYKMLMVDRVCQLTHSLIGTVTVTQTMLSH